jgi:hypothetical protein
MYRMWAERVPGMFTDKLRAVLTVAADVLRGSNVMRTMRPSVACPRRMRWRKLALFFRSLPGRDDQHFGLPS